MLEWIAPQNIEYAHNLKWGDGNGHSHVRAALLGPSLSVPFSGGRMQLGTWQQIIFIDLDNRPRDRKLIVQIVGEGSTWYSSNRLRWNGFCKTRSRGTVAPSGADKPPLTGGLYGMGSDLSSMERGELCRNRCTSLLLADYTQDRGAARPNAKSLCAGSVLKSGVW